MPDNHLRIQSSDKRQILVVDDELINRELLGMILSEDYALLFASNGEEAIRLIREHAETLSLILLDLIMPVMSGMVVLKMLKEKAEWAKIPVIVMTADHESEAVSLEMGAMDFIPKPYPQQNVILARLRRIIELSEDRKIIHSTERDSLTGLYNREFFYNYAETFDQHHKQEPMDACVLDINHFHLINERYGRLFADQTLQQIGWNLREMVQKTGGIVCRRAADTFMIYCPHRDEHASILETAAAGIADGGDEKNRIRLRLGVYPDVDKALGMEQRFDRAKTAADLVRNNYSQNVAYYDNRLHDREMLAEQLTEDFDKAIREKQFVVYYQPKFDIRPDEPVLSSAEALIRWQHPELGLVSPGIFVPLFEENGMIERLDHYVWEEAAIRIKAWKDEYGIKVPVSVNVSRVDMTDPGIVDFFRALLSRYHLDPEDLILEITESAYSEDEELIISTVNALRTLGFRVEMDDFGTGYSSLGMISKLPIDALKLDMIFVRNAFAGQGDMKMIELIIDIAAYLRVPVIAEGVETKEQADVLKAMGCDIIQGYYFSKPVPPEAFRVFLEEKKRMLAMEDDRKKQENPDSLARAEEVMRDALTYARISQALAQDYFTVYYINTKTGAYIEYSMRGEDHRLFPVAGGESFFADCVRQIPDRIIPADQGRVAAAFDERNLLRTIRSNRKFSINYQVLVNGSPMNVSVKAIRVPDDPDHILIGMSNIDEQVERDRAYQEALEKSVTYASLAQALAADYFSIYYVDTETDRFFEFTAHDAYEDLRIEKEGEDFFNLSRQNVRRVVYQEDQGMFLDVFTKENVLRKIRENGAFTVTYRLLFNGVPKYVSLKATPKTGNDLKHIVIGVNNIDTQMQRQAAYERARRQSEMYLRIVQALSEDYYSIYMVNMNTDEFVEYSSAPEYKELKVEQSGRNFFEDCRKNVIRLVHPDDLKKALTVWEKERLQKELDSGKSFSVTYRLMFDGNAVYINCKVIRMTGEDEGYILIGISNVDLQIRREQEYEQHLKDARLAALRDPLTGVKSKHAFTEKEREMNDAIREGTQEPFAVAVCDLNGLKAVNDTLGHKAGDQYIRDACRIICNQFKHSPVYRVGGDEFVAVLQGSDYQEKEALIEHFTAQNGERCRNGEVVIACGIADWEEAGKEPFESVFQRADQKMYENKKDLKSM